MLIPEEYIEVLADLGLTHNEAKVYLALLCLQSSTASRLHKETNIARQDVYRVLSELREKELIEKVIARPTKFKPIPSKETISILLQRRKEKNLQLRKKANRLFRNFIETCTVKPFFDEASQFILLSRSEADPKGHIDKLGKTLDKAKKSATGVITFPFFMKVKQMDEDIWKRAVRRGVKIRFMIDKQSDGNLDLALDPVLAKSDCFEVRWTSSVVPATVLLIDDRESFCRTGVKIDNPVLWSSAPGFVAMIKDYLETKWKSLEKT
jgi:sugar-specific transcriptional regulator TrmB